MYSPLEGCSSFDKVERGSPKTSRARSLGKASVGASSRCRLCPLAQHDHVHCDEPRFRAKNCPQRDEARGLRCGGSASRRSVRTAAVTCNWHRPGRTWGNPSTRAQARRALPTYCCAEISRTTAGLPPLPAKPCSGPHSARLPPLPARRRATEKWGGWGKL